MRREITIDIDEESIEVDDVDFDHEIETSPTGEHKVAVRINEVDASCDADVSMRLTPEDQTEEGADLTEPQEQLIEHLESVIDLIESGKYGRIGYDNNITREKWFNGPATTIEEREWKADLGDYDLNLIVEDP